MIIRPAVLNDVDFILTANQAIDAANGIEKPSYLTAETIRDDIFSMTPKAFVVIAEQNGKPAGLVLYTYIYFASSGRSVWISNLYVSATFRQQGIAGKLVKHLKENHAGSGVFWATYRVNKSMFQFADKLQATSYPDIIMFGLPKS